MTSIHKNFNFSRKDAKIAKKYRWSNEFDPTVGPNSFGQQSCHQKECVSSKLMCYPLNQGKIRKY